ncbi:ABC transporter permease [Flavobacterium microcysteis]|uniref:FtsX-like permease family protein n=1 Tax=Flavobacterium microcysteis TaxID=2596891 RepID=A0A501Q7T2_9FLAO|nr:ABC transporter permease [Flavobacterium microcysteis]TPD68382.1 FtsX-like permease family protein [Flavobacterium microcysteis]
MLKNWLKIFLYQIKNNKIFTALNILGLSMGIAGLVFAILYWNDEHSYNEWNPDKERIFLSISDLGENMLWATNLAGYEPYLKDYEELESYCYFDADYEEDMVSYKRKKETLKITDAQKTFFEFFPFEFIKGSAKNALADNNSMALSEAAAQKLFGDEDPIGREVTYSEKKYVVRALYKVPGKSSMAPEVVISTIDRRLEEDRTQWGNFNYGLMLKLKNPEQTGSVKSKLERLMHENRELKWAREEGITPEQWRKKNSEGQVSKIILEPLTAARLHSVTSNYGEGRGSYQFLLIMMGLSLLILTLSIVNYVNLATANAIKRAKEVGVRKIMGASRGNIVKQFIFETAVMTGFAILISLVIVELSLPYYNEFLRKDLIIHSGQFYLQIVLIFGLVVLLAGIFPAIYVSNFETLKVLKGNFGRSKNGIWLRNGMLILQFAIASFFIVGSYIVYEQVSYMSSKDLGFKGDQVVQVNYRNPYDFKEKGYLEKIVLRYETIRQELLKIKGVKQVSIGSFDFGGGAQASSGYEYNKKAIQGRNMAIDFDLLSMMNIKLAKGRDLSPSLSTDTMQNILINEAALRLMNEKDPIGKEINWNDKKLKIVGVAKDFHVSGPQEEIPPMTIFHYKTIPWMIQNAHQIFIKIDAEYMESAMKEIENFWIKKVDTEYPFKYDFVNKSYARSYQAYVNQRNLFSLLNLAVIFIALSGLFALASYSIQRRMKEIAIRKTLGAETKTLLKELSKQYVVFCIAGFLIALFPVYFLLNKWLENFAYRIDISIVPFVVGFLALLLLMLIVVLSRAYQATRVNVLKYLKYE